MDNPYAYHSAGAAPPKRFHLGPQNALSEAELQRVRKLAEVFISELQKGYITAAPPLHNAPHWFSTPIDLSGQLTVSSVTPWTPLCTYKVEPGRRGFIHQYGVDVLDPSYPYNGVILWRITVNGNPVPTLEEFAEHRGSLVHPRTTYIRLQEGDVVRLETRRTNSGSQHVVFGALIGWVGKPRRDYDGSLASLAH